MSESDTAGQPQTVLENLSFRNLMGKQLTIPNYQRSYTWNSTHVLDLLKDITKRERSYLLGTIILHANATHYDIVDGQQRLVTLTVLLHSLGVSDERLPLLSTASFPENAAIVIRNTQKVIADFLYSNDKEKLKKWLWPDDGNETNTLRFAVLTLVGDNALDRAYTFFDSVNSKGKALSDFDLLKAHHLMFIPTAQEELAMTHNNGWQNHDEEHRAVFTQCLRRLRMWAKGRDRDNKTERPDYNEFVSVGDPEEGGGAEHPLTRYMQPAVFRSWRRDGTRIILSMDYPIRDNDEMIPTQITQTIEGGDPFFIYAKRYHSLHRHLFDSSNKATIVSSAVKFVRRLLNCFNGGYKSTAYLRDVLQPILLLYVDKFGEDRLIDAAVCMERIISSKLWVAPPNGLRIEGVLSHVQDKVLVPVLLDATNVHHALTLLRSKAQGCASPKPDTNLKRRHHETMIGFYMNNAANIVDVGIREMVSKKVSERCGD